MIVALSALAGAIAGIALCAIGKSQDQPVSRRACVRLLILGATGLSLLPGCGGHDAPLAGLVRKWARLGWVWREMSAHARGGLPDWEQREAFAELRGEMETALSALPAWSELREVFIARYERIERVVFGSPSCYVPLASVPILVPGVVEGQVYELEKLIDEGRLSEPAALAAAEVLAVQAEYIAREAEAKQLRRAERGPVLARLARRYFNGILKPGRPATLAGKRLTELTVDKLGWLAGPPQENEGFTESTVEAEAGQEEAD